MNLRKLIKKYLKGKTNALEDNQVDEFYHYLPSEGHDLNDFNEEEKTALEKAIWQKIQLAKDSREIQGPKPNYYKWAAVIAIPLLMAGLFLMKENKPTDESLLLAQPGSFTANLVTPEGKTYSLASIDDLQKLQQQGIYQGQTDTEQPVLMHEIQTPKGGYYQLILPDSSKVWLNAASTIRFPSRFAANKREVYLEGEGYFDVTHHPEAPFTVKTAKQTTRVLGTKFNINAYADVEEDWVTLIEGSVEATSLTQEKVLMKPGYQAKIGQRIAYAKVDHAADFAAWRSGDFFFDNTPLKQVLHMLGRWYNLDVDTQHVPDNRINGLIPRNVPLKDILNLLETTSKITITVKDGKLKVQP